MLKKVSYYTRPPQARQDVPLPSEAAGEGKLEAYRYFTHPTLGRPRSALTHGYVEDCLEPRTKLETFFSIVLKP